MFSKMSSEPPPYSPEPSGGFGAAPSAPPREMGNTMPVQLLVQPAPQVNVVNHHTVMVDNCKNGMICPHCNARIRMRVEHHPTCCTYTWSALLCLFLCWPCVCVPCCCNCAYQTSQYCPNCKACLGRF